MAEGKDNYANILLRRLGESAYSSDKISLTSEIDNQKFPIHCNILAAASKYFTAALGPNFLESKKSEFILEGTDGQTVKAIVDFCYTGCIELNEENVGRFLMIASSVELDLLEDKCRRFYDDSLSTNSSVEALMVAEKYNYTDLRKKAINWICETFEMVPSTAIKSLDHKMFKELLKCDKLKATQEVKFGRLLEWFRSNEDERKEYMPELLKLIRLEQITLESDCIGTLMVANEYDYVQLRQRALDIISARFEKLSSSEVCKFDHRSLREVLGKNLIQATEELVFTRLLEWFRSEEDERRQYMPELLKIIRLEHITPQFMDATFDAVFESFQCLEHVLAEYKRRALQPYANIDVRRSRSIYCLFRRLKMDKDAVCSAIRIEKYNNVLNRFEDAAEITLDDRLYFNAVLQKNKLFFLGGSTSDTALKCVSSYDLSSGEESVLPEMNKPRVECWPFIFGKYIYVFGGYNNDGELNSCERFNTENKEWKDISPMNQSRYVTRTAALNGNIYVAGGVAKGKKIASVEQYDPECDEWTNMKPMNHARAWFALIEFNGFLYALGGGAAVAEKYHPYKGCWTDIGSFDGSDLITSGIVVHGQIFVIMLNGKFGEIKFDQSGKCSFVPLG